jgi:eukaryotic-like serine/threonine-protein kinase
MSELIGQTLGDRYRVEAYLGRGGMADVYRVWDQQRAVPLAMKVLHKEMAADPVFLRRFEREAEVLERLQHPHIVRFYGLVKTGGLAFILMDFIDGLSLKREIDLSKGGMRPGRVLTVLEPVCAALHYAHQQGMVHCDIKPANIMIHSNGVVYLTDFGIARAAAAAPVATAASTATAAPTTDTAHSKTTSTRSRGTNARSGANKAHSEASTARSEAPSSPNPVTAGTPAYMAPEHLSGQEPGPAADIYSLGIVLYEMLTGGKRPFTGSDAQITGSTAQRIAWEKHHLPVPSPRTYRPDLSPELELVVMRCLERNPKARFPSALHLLHALQEAVHTAHEEETNTLANIEEDGEPQVVDEDAAPRAAEQIAPRGNPFTRIPVRWVALALTAILLIALAGIGLGIRSLLHGSQPPGDTAGVEKTRAAGTAQAAVPLTSPSATPTPPPPTATDVPPEPTATPFGGGPGLAGWIAFASDRSGSVQVWVMDANGDNRRQITNVEKGACQPAWSPDGAKMVYITPCNGPRITYPGANIEYVEIETGAVTKLNLLGGGFQPAWSPDGKAIAYTKLSDGRTTIYAYSLETQTNTILANQGEKNMDPAWSPDGRYIAYTSLDQGVDEIWRMRSDGSSQEQLTQAGGLKYFTQPAWSPDGRSLLATLTELNVAGPVLTVIDLSSPQKGGEPFYKGRARKETARMEEGTFSPDGKWVVYWTQPEGNNMEILRVGKDGKVVNLTNDKARDFQPAWEERRGDTETR